MKLFISINLILAALFGEPDFTSLKREYDSSPLEKFRSEYSLGGSLQVVVLGESYTPRFLIEEEISWLKKTIETAKRSVAIDEKLRRQLINLYQDSAAARSNEVLALLEEGLNLYVFNEELIHEEAQEELISLQQLALDPNEMVASAKKLEEELTLSPLKKDKVRCGMTVRAILYHLLGGKLTRETKEKIEAKQKGITALKERIDAEEESIFVVDSDRFDHIFVILRLKSGGYRVLQSFVNHYSFAANLRESKTLNYEELQTFLSKLELLDQTAEWGERVEALYKDLFLADPPAHLKKEFENSTPDFQFASMTTPL